MIESRADCQVGSHEFTISDQPEGNGGGAAQILLYPGDDAGRGVAPAAILAANNLSQPIQSHLVGMVLPREENGGWVLGSLWTVLG